MGAALKRLSEGIPDHYLNRTFACAVCADFVFASSRTSYTSHNTSIVHFDHIILMSVIQHSCTSYNTHTRHTALTTRHTTLIIHVIQHPLYFTRSKTHIHVTTLIHATQHFLPRVILYNTHTHVIRHSFTRTRGR